MSCCSSPIEYFIEYADFAFQNSGFTMQDVLTIGHIFPNTINMCCPDYCSEEYVLLGENSDFVDFDENVGFSFGQCCVNLYSYSESLIPDYILSSDFIACCNTNNTSKCVNELLEHTNSTALKEWFYNLSSSTGLFEYNTINQNFGFCELVEILKTKTPTVAEEYMLAILQLGLVVRCVSNGTFVGSIQTYIDLYGSSGPA